MFFGGEFLEAEKNGKVKLTVELEINQPLMDLIKQDVESVSEMAAQGMSAWRQNRGQGEKTGHPGMDLMHHGQE